jgi:hypothetical protein
MTAPRPGRRSRLALALLSLSVLALSGCAVVDCAFTYHVSGRLVNGDTGAPLAGSRVAATRRQFESATSDNWPGWAHSDSTGRFMADLVTGPAWGYSLLFGFIPLGSRIGPVPPPLDTFFITAEDAGGARQTSEVATPAGGQERTAPAERWIELGDLSVGGIIDE